MGCNCGKSSTATLQKSRAVAAKARTVGSTTTTGCMKKYDQLAMLDRKIIALHKKFRLVGEVSKRYADMQKTVRSWIVDLKTKCPDETELSEMSEYVNEQYSKFFSAK